MLWKLHLDPWMPISYDSFVHVQQDTHGA
uniref:Uncharacterized protein n=1 Tax=Arundo donax TaxID=35708 RepID=A0A0A9ACT6_ARUDO